MRLCVPEGAQALDGPRLVYTMVHESLDLALPHGAQLAVLFLHYARKEQDRVYTELSTARAKYFGLKAALGHAVLPPPASRSARDRLLFAAEVAVRQAGFETFSVVTVVRLV